MNKDHPKENVEDSLYGQVVFIWSLLLFYFIKEGLFKCGFYYLQGGLYSEVVFNTSLTLFEKKMYL